MTANYMQMAYAEAKQGIEQGEGGPFGAVIVNAAGVVIARAHNQVLLRHDPTAHAEIQALRLAGEVQGSHDLAGCALYTTCEPCPMCLAAILWANIRQIYYACDRHDAADIGFRDAWLYEYFKSGHLEEFTLIQSDRELCLPLFETYRKEQMTLY
jgi:guanine deaminase